MPKPKEYILRADKDEPTNYLITIFIDSMNAVTIPVNKFGIIVKDSTGKKLGDFFAQNKDCSFEPSIQELRASVSPHDFVKEE